MTTTYSAASTARSPDRVRPHLLVVAAVSLAVLGAALAVWALTIGRPPPGPARVGSPVETGFGTFAVTRVSTTFVPDTQGPPSHAQHVGANGTQQLQVWVRIVNDGRTATVAYAPSQFRAVGNAASIGGLRPDGSSLGVGRLEPGTSIEGQVWFDLKAGVSIPRSLRYDGPGNAEVLVSLNPPPPPTPAHSPHHG